MKTKQSNYRLRKDIDHEVFLFLACFIVFFVLIANRMGFTNMVNTIMNTSYDLLVNICFYLMAISVVAGGIGELFSEFGVISLINRILSGIMKPLYDLPGAASLGIITCFLSDNPAVLTLAEDDNFRRYFKKYQLPALCNLATSFGMGLIICTSMMALPIDHSIQASMIGLIGAVIGSIVSVRLMIYKSKKRYGTTEMVKTRDVQGIPLNHRIIREGTIGNRFISSLLDGGKKGVMMGVAIIPGVVLICTIVILLTNGPGVSGYDGSANQGIAFLPMVGKKLHFLLKPLFGFENDACIAVPITALGSSGASLGLVANMVNEHVVSANDIAVFTSICMCWSGYLSTHIAMMDALGTNEMTKDAILSHTIGGLVGGMCAHFLFMIFI